MSDIIYYTELIQNLVTQISSVEDENAELKKKLCKCESKLQMMELFYSDFKDIIKSEINIPKDILSNENASTIAMPGYENLLSEYLVTKNPEIAERLFNDHTVSPSQILTDIRNSLPENIVDLTKRYDCEKEYGIILTSLKHIENFSKSGHFTEKGMMDLVDRYITQFNKGKKEVALKYIKQVLVFFPFQFDKFLLNTKQYQYDDAEQYIETLKIELYGKNNILLINKNNVSNELVKRIRVKKIDYANSSILEIVDYVKSIKNNQKQRAVQILDNLKNANRSDEDCSLYKNNVNMFLKNKL